MKYTLGQTAKAVGLSKTTLIGHIKSGKLSTDWNNETNPPQREIDGSEILRVYGVDIAMPHSRRVTPTTPKESENTPLDLILKAKDETIATLKAEVDRLANQIEVKDEQIAQATRLLAAPKPDDRYDALLEKLAELEREFHSAAEEPPAPPKSEVAPPPPNQGILGWLRRKVA